MEFASLHGNFEKENIIKQGKNMKTLNALPVLIMPAPKTKTINKKEINMNRIMLLLSIAFLPTIAQASTPNTFSFKCERVANVGHLDPNVFYDDAEIDLSHCKLLKVNGPGVPLKETVDAFRHSNLFLRVYSGDRFSTITRKTVPTEPLMNFFRKAFAEESPIYLDISFWFPKIGPGTIYNYWHLTSVKTKGSVYTAELPNVYASHR